MREDAIYTQSTQAITERGYRVTEEERRSAKKKYTLAQYAVQRTTNEEKRE